MEYNPLTAQVRSRREAFDQLRNSGSELRQELAWYDVFDPAATTNRAATEEARVANLAVQLAELERELTKARERIEGIRPASRLGWNPSYWLSETRSRAVSELAQFHAEIEKRQADKRQHAEDRARSLAHLANARESLERYSKFDREVVEAGLTRLEVEIGRTGAELDKWEPREKALDKELEAPMQKLLDLRSRLDGLKGDLERAKRFERELSGAANSYERKQIHDECERRFGKGSPREVIKRTERAIDGDERNIAKLERRLQDIGRRGALDVQKLVIDGSNLCYEAGKLIGLFALRALCAQLANDFVVIVVFDASIREKLGVLSDDTLRTKLPGAKVYVAASQAGADETILDAAQDPTTFVVSNDRFADFPEKPAVRDDRIIRHEIINGHVLVRDLSIDVEYSNQRES